MKKPGRNILISTDQAKNWDILLYNSMEYSGKIQVRRYFEDHVQFSLSFQFGTIWIKIGGVINF